MVAPHLRNCCGSPRDRAGLAARSEPSTEAALCEALRAEPPSLPDFILRVLGAIGPEKISSEPEEPRDVVRELSPAEPSGASRALQERSNVIAALERRERSAVCVPTLDLRESGAQVFAPVIRVCCCHHKGTRCWLSKQFNSHSHKCQQSGASGVSGS